MGQDLAKQFRTVIYLVRSRISSPYTIKRVLLNTLYTSYKLIQNPYFEFYFDHAWLS